jgi:CheY-like chemotaxis protein
MAGERLLVVDDNATNMKLLRVLLMTEGYEVRTAVDAKEALAILGSFRPQLILMDVQLPGMSGLELTQQLKADPAMRDIIVLAVTAYAMKGDEERARAAGCDGYLSKPIDTRTLATTVAKHLSAAHPRGK